MPIDSQTKTKLLIRLSEFGPKPFGDLSREGAACLLLLAKPSSAAYSRSIAAQSWPMEHAIGRLRPGREQEHRFAKQEHEQDCVTQSFVVVSAGG